MGDVHNLAYKLAAINHGWGGPRLLETYESDRRQIALVNAHQSIKNGNEIFQLLKSLDAIWVDQTQAGTNLIKNISDPSHRTRILKGIESQREHFDNLGLHIGYVYGDHEIPASASLFTPSYRPGARLPHAWLLGKPSRPSFPQISPIDCSYVAEFSPQEIESRKYSTLDLCAYDAFTFIVDESSARRWTNELERIPYYLPTSASKSLGINLFVMEQDFHLMPGIRSDAWIKGFQLRNGTGVLVRPDQHILDTFADTLSVEDISRRLILHLGL